MRYYHEFDTEKNSPLHPEYRCGFFIGEEWFDEDGLTEEQELLVEEMDLPLEEGYFLCDNNSYEDAYGPCLYDVKRDVFENCDGFEIRNENYKENQEVEESLDYRVKRLEKKVKELETLSGFNWSYIRY